MTTPSPINEYSQAEEPARVLLERLGWTYVPREGAGGGARRGARGTAEGGGCGPPCCVSTSG